MIGVLFRLLQDEEVPALSKLTPEQKQSYWVGLYENPIFRAYCNQRRDYLRNEVADAIMVGSSGNAWIFAGQIKEILELARNARAAYLAKEKSLAQGNKRIAS